MLDLMAEDFLGESLIFIISQPRAGSTLLQRILAGHPTLRTSAEPWLMLHPVYALRTEGVQAEFDSDWARSALNDFLTHYADGEETYLKAIRAMANVLYGRALAGTGKTYFIDKTPRYYFIIPELYRLFPKASFIFLVRNPLGVLYSVLSTWVQGNWPVLAKYRHDLLSAPQRILEGIDIVGRNGAVVRYEQLVSDPCRITSSLCSMLGLAFDPEMLRYGDREAPKGSWGDETGIHKYQSPTIERRDNWLHLADTMQMKHFALAYLNTLGPSLVERLGYSFEELIHPFNTIKHPGPRGYFPWNIAIRPSESWTRKDRLDAYRAMAVQEKGILHGTFSFAWQNALPLLRQHLRF